MTEKIAAAGQILADAWKNETLIDALPKDLFPDDIAQAIAIQDEMAKQIGEEVVGWKVAGRPGPLVGRIFESTVFTNPATLSKARFQKAGVECELAFRLDEDLPPRQGEYGRDEVLDAANLVLTLEIIDRRFHNGIPIPNNDDEKLEIIADNAANGGMVVGPEVPGWRSMSLLDITVDLSIDGGPSQPLQPRDGRVDPADVFAAYIVQQHKQRRIVLVNIDLG